MQPIVLINTVGLTTRRLALAPRLGALAKAGWHRPLEEVWPAVTCTAQASMLTGESPQVHGIVGNGWLFKDTMEVRFWQQSNHLLQAEPVYATARRRAAAQGRAFRCAKLFWWFNQGATLDISVTPKPHYGADGSKAFDILAYPDGLAGDLKKALGDFPFTTFWGPMAGLPATAWIARCAAEVLKGKGGPPDLTLVYLPHLDYDTQRLGPEGCDWKKIVGDLDAACEPLLDAARKVGARVWVTNEYSHAQVSLPVYLNRALRKLGWLVARLGPFGEMLDTFASRAFAVCDHQLAHVYLQESNEAERLRDLLANLEGVDRLLIGPQRGEIGLDHPRAGDLVVVAKPKAWFAYPYWLEDRHAPDFARTVDIHRKPGYDPCELFFDPKRLWAKGRAIRKVLLKKLGVRTLVDVIPLDANLVKGSHGLPSADPQDKPVIIGDGPAPADGPLAMAAVQKVLLAAMSL